MSGSPTRRNPNNALTKKMSTQYEARGLAEVNVDNVQIAGLHTENNRERTMNESLQRDVQMLREQLARAEDIRQKQEARIVEAHANIKHQQEQF